MKKQTYISYLEDKEGKRLDFERWAYKKPSTILDKLKILYNDYYSIYKDNIEKSEYVTIYKTPDGYNKEEEPEIKMNIKELLGVRQC